MNSLSHRSSQRAIWCRLVQSSRLIRATAALTLTIMLSFLSLFRIIKIFLINVYHSCEPAGFTHALSATLLSPISHFNQPPRIPCQSRLNQPEPLNKLPSCSVPVSLALLPRLNCCPAATSIFSHLLPSRNFDSMPHSGTHLSLRPVIPTPLSLLQDALLASDAISLLKRSVATAAPRTAAPHVI